jgi:hypothetical protein
MSKSLKEKNARRLLAVIAANLAAYVIVVKGAAIAAGDWQTLRAAKELLPVGAGMVITGVVNGLLSPQAKARLVFWRWTHPLPGCRAFSVHAKSDARVNMAALRASLGTIPKPEAEQNATWYRLYRSIESDAAVSNAQREYLFTRDYAALAALMIAPLGVAAYLQADSYRTALGYLLILVAQYLVVRSAAANYGERFVTTVLAIKSAET